MTTTIPTDGHSAAHRHGGHRTRLAAGCAVLTVAVAGVALPAAGAAASGPTSARIAAATTKTVTLKDIAFKPARVVINHGGSVRWVWKDGVVSHNVTSKGKLRFHSSTTKLKGSYTVRFTKPGTYRYSCTIHFGMDGTVVVH